MLQLLELEQASPMKRKLRLTLLALPVVLAALAVCGENAGQSVSPSVKRRETVTPVVLPTQHRGSLQINIRSIKETYRASESVEVEVSLQNRGEDPLLFFPVIS